MPNTAPSAAARRAYEAPRLVVHGSLRELTQTIQRTGRTADNNRRTTFRS